MFRCRTFGLCVLFVVASFGGAGLVAQNEATAQSFYITVPDDETRLAVDVYLPPGRNPQAKLPALLELTRYWRSREDATTGEPLPSLGSVDRFLLEHDYVLVKVDVRGSGASFGHRLEEYGPREVKDGYAVVDWVVSQAWSNGKVGAYGTSYAGTTAELITAVNHPAIKAVIPGWSDFDAFRSPARPYGLIASGFIRLWSEFVGQLDRNDTKAMKASVRRVDNDPDGSKLAAAVAEHTANPDVFQMLTQAEFIDHKMGRGASLAECASPFWKKEIETSGVAMLVFASWLDAGTADGALLRFQHYSNPQQVVILASSHGGGFHASPYRVADKKVPPVPSFQDQMAIRLKFFDHHLKGKRTGISKWPGIRYFNMGEEAFHDTATWPPKGMVYQRYYFHEKGGLTPKPPTSAEGADLYQVNLGVSTGTNNRWMTQMGLPVLRLHDRGAMDRRMLTYTSEPLSADLQLTGAPVVGLWVSSDQTDGAFLVYLEDVDPSGQSRYVTEGGLRAIHRKRSKNPDFDQNTPFHSFKKADAQPLVPGRPTELVFQGFL